MCVWRGILFEGAQIVSPPEREENWYMIKLEIFWGKKDFSRGNGISVGFSVEKQFFSISLNSEV